MAELNPEVMNALVRVMETDDLSTLDDATIKNGMYAIRAQMKKLGQSAAELHRRGWTWPQIAEGLEVNQSTAHRWAQPYIKDEDPR